MFLEAWEVPLYSESKDKYDTKFVVNILDAEEYAFFTTHLGKSAYNCLVNHKTEYDNVCEWSKSVQYAQGQYVRFANEVYMALATIPQIGVTPVDNLSRWELQERFGEPFLNKLWRNHLRKLVALTVYRASLPQSTFQASSSGVVALHQDNTGNRGATRGELSYLMDSIAQRIYNGVEFMKNYLELNKESIPCIEWRVACGCTDDDGSPVKNPHSGSRKFFI